MAEFYEGAHSVLFLNDSEFSTLKSSAYKVKHTHSWNDWYLIPSSRPEIPEPKPKKTVIDIPGMNGGLDISELLTGGILFANRTGSLNFIVDNDHRDWNTEKQLIVNKLHGKVLKMILLDDKEYYYEGRFTFDAWKSDARNSSITIGYEVQPFKYPVFDSDEDWLWDPFNFETGIIRCYKNIAVVSSNTVNVISGTERVSPTITVDTAMAVTFDGVVYQLSAGSNYVSGIVLKEGVNSLYFTGSGTINSIKIKSGYL